MSIIKRFPRFTFTYLYKFRPKGKGDNKRAILVTEGPNGPTYSTNRRQFKCQKRTPFWRLFLSSF